MNALVAEARSASLPPPCPDSRETLPPIPLSVDSVRRNDRIRVAVPCSIANLGPGFDTLAMCLERPHDRIVVEPARRSELTVTGDGSVPRDWSTNAATVALDALVRQSGRRRAARVRLIKGAPAGTGIGSSGASAVAGALAGAAYLGLDWAHSRVREWVLAAAVEGEESASGARHADNVAASMFGGITVVEPGEPPTVHRFRPRLPIGVAIAVPRVRVETRRLRSILPDVVPRHDAIENVARSSALLLSLVRGDGPAAGRNLVDRLAEPYRAALLPRTVPPRARALHAGAWGVAVAGSGPALFALAPVASAAGVAHALVEGFEEVGVSAVGFTSRIGRGPRALAPRTALDPWGPGGCDAPSA